MTQSDLFLLLLCNLCSPFGRGVPDIAAQALKLPIILNGDAYIMSGTSGSTPVRLSLLPLSFLRTSSST